MYSVGITGGIGSGKTSVSQSFQVLGVPIYNSDQRAKALMVENESLIAQIKSVFGTKAYQNGKPNRSYLAQQVFSDVSKLEKLNTLVHPAVFQDYNEWKQKITFPYHLKEAAILIESGSYRDCDEIILVTAPLEERIQRVIKRDETTKEAVEDRISKQMSDEEKEAYCQYILINDNSSPLLDKILRLHQHFLQSGKN